MGKKNGWRWTAEGWGLDLDESNNVYVSGQFTDSCVFNPPPDSIVLRSMGYFDGFLQKINQSGVYGYVFNDINEDCILNENVIGLPTVTLLINPGNLVVQTNDFGRWSLDFLEVGNYTISVDSINTWLPTCNYVQSFSITNTSNTTAAPNFGFIPSTPCAKPDVSIFTPILRSCFSNQIIYVQACNQQLATGALNDAFVDIKIDDMLILQSASIPYINIGDSTYRFQLGDIVPGNCKYINLFCMVDCNASLGQTLCMQANLFPADSCVFDTIPTPPLPPIIGGGTVTPCTTAWDKSSLSVNGYCQNDSIYFTITNTGELGGGDMSCYAPVRVYVDGIFFMLDSIQLNGGETIVFAFDGDGRTWRLEADQHPLHPGNSHPNASVEACGDLANWTPGLVSALPQNDADPIVDIYCGVVTGSYDPNDKTGYPIGISSQHYIMPNQQLQYVIRFQNTGTDTAFTVIIRDTLDTDLDIFSVVSGVASHNCTFKMYGQRILEWSFYNILLPDSNHNEDASHGFVTYSVNQIPNLSNGTVISNAAAIYFDYNEPVITNETWHQVNDMTIVFTETKSSLINDKTTEIKIYPNPATSELFIELAEPFNYTGKAIANYKLISFDGRTIKNGKLNSNKNKVSTNNIENGIYILEVTSGEKKYFNKVVVSK